jgi:hypothetical protein
MALKPFKRFAAEPFRARRENHNVVKPPLEQMGIAEFVFVRQSMIHRIAFVRIRLRPIDKSDAPLIVRYAIVKVEDSDFVSDFVSDFACHFISTLYIHGILVLLRQTRREGLLASLFIPFSFLSLF